MTTSHRNTVGGHSGIFDDIDQDGNVKTVQKHHLSLQRCRRERENSADAPLSP